MGGVESTTGGTVIRNGDWEHRICWSESKPSINSLDSPRHNVSPKRRYYINQESYEEGGIMKYDH